MSRNDVTGMALSAVLALSALSWTAYGLFGFDVFSLMGPEMTGGLAMIIGGLGAYDAADTFGIIDNC
ncbi:uncharacterized protein NP_2336A [Natronomonas pharaonis DSM 2160]|uniref:Uncharacterized protein n=1 Tax=Natronomonas pharaonis (strain ATCC 35678 / DSM 2160 / CIP 103997 / JCM 8858 / NBRC 14720 / NCIMB 2260 / Gabara) TaxID=348780 RepID=A0A1U7EW16_NATPD|nr:hypothetical protein [Natronomonas pharaonis]CAI49259.1 uncharacterized protein NP_2336A [Natronomonas pharaonis DSM 2160]